MILYLIFCIIGPVLLFISPIAIFIYCKVSSKSYNKKMASKITDDNKKTDLSGIVSTKGLSDLWEDNKKRYKDFIELT